ncbi:T9SS type A sorting domain-containing protein [Saccharicrinis aurantiacus]|uniref:T9SS type A sorting domain-containing protein n=1 Tax=Saccharicrinis aurantiacus TaxID=1849719 RepID=UPI002493585F|nr:T9SS type A sorting domain-containing protein [Saccharicrinis aurantiacus]
MKTRCYYAYLIKYLIAILFIVIISKGGYAQESINSCGKSLISNNYSYSYSIGQIFIEPSSIENNSQFFTSGVQYFEFVSIPNQSAQISGKSLKFNLYPNPVISHLNVSITDTDLENAELYLYNFMGEVISTYTMDRNLISIDMSKFASGAYILKVTNNEDQVAFRRFLKK